MYIRTSEAVTRSKDKITNKNNNSKYTVTLAYQQVHRLFRYEKEKIIIID